MIATAHRIRGFGVLLFSASLAIAAPAAAADFQNQYQSMEPVPQSMAPVGQPSAVGVNPVGPPIQGSDAVVVDDSESLDLPICSLPGQFWLRADYMMWWTNGMRLPPLVTTSTQGTAQADAGVLGKSTTSILFGNQTVNDGGRSGFRTTLGFWLDACHVWDVEFDYLDMGEQSTSFRSGLSTGNPILARPFFDVQHNQQASELVALTGAASGSVDVDTKDYFQSAGVLLSYNLCNSNLCSPYDVCDGSTPGPCGLPMLYGCRTDLLMGFRYYSLSDRVGIHENVLMPVPDATHPNAPPAASFDIHDEFRGRNDFYGSELGLRTPDLPRPVVVGHPDQDRHGQQP